MSEMAPLLALVLAAADFGVLHGYVFREAGGDPPRRPVTVELLDQDRYRYRQTARPDGSFAFEKVREGRYTIRARAGDFVLVEDVLAVAPGTDNFAALMLPKRWAGARTFGTVSVGRLAAQSDRALQKKLRQAAELAQRRDWAAAARIYEEAAATGAPADVWDALGLLHLRLGRHEDAWRAFEKAIQLDPAFLFPYAHLAAAYLEGRHYRDLAAIASRALAADPNWLTGHAFLAEAQAGLGQWEAAEHSAETASRLAAGRAPAPYLLLAKIRWARGDCAAARKHLQRYIELNTSARALPETVRSIQILSACRPAP
jgi:tetratricopeptide (TPR) repeat protein